MTREEIYSEVLRLFNECETHIGRVEVITDYIVRILEPLTARDAFLTELEIAGVDNWDGFSEAQENFTKTQDGDDLR